MQEQIVMMIFTSILLNLGATEAETDILWARFLAGGSLSVGTPTKLLNDIKDMLREVRESPIEHS